MTRGQRPNESQKAVIIDMMKSVGEIASKMWPGSISRDCQDGGRFLRLSLQKLFVLQVKIYIYTV